MCFVTSITICGCGSKDTGKGDFVKTFFGNRFPTNLVVEHYSSEALGGGAAIARVTGTSNDVKSVLTSQGFRETTGDQAIQSGELLQLRISSISSDVTPKFLTNNSVAANYFFNSQDLPTELREFYVLTNYTQFYLIVIKR